MIVAHIMGIPVEESLVQMPATAATMTAVAIAARTTLARLRRRRSSAARPEQAGKN